MTWVKLKTVENEGDLLRASSSKKCENTSPSPYFPERGSTIFFRRKLQKSNWNYDVETWAANSRRDEPGRCHIFHLLFTGILAQEERKGMKHSFEIRPGDRPGQEIGSRVRWVNPSWPGSTKKKKHNTTPYKLNALPVQLRQNQEIPHQIFQKCPQCFDQTLSPAQA